MTKKTENSPAIPDLYPTEINPFTGKEQPMIPKNYRTARIKNLTTAEIEKNIFLAFEIIGGLSRFAKWADEHEDEFFKVYMKTVPPVAPLKHGTPEQAAIMINLMNGNQLPASPLDDIQIRDESVVNARYDVKK